MSIKEKLGNRLRELRISRGFTQEDLAEKVNLSAKSLSQVEIGNNFISAATLELLCQALNVEAKALFNFNDSNKSSDDAIKEIVAKLEKNPQLLNTIYKIVLALDS